MSETKPKDYDLWPNVDHELVGKQRLDVRYDTLMSNAMTEMDGPLRMSAGFPTADSKLYFKESGFILGSGAKRELPPLKNQVFSIPLSSVDFQTQATSGATFLIDWPATNVIGQFRRVGFTLISSGDIQLLFSEEAASIAATGEAGALFSKGIPIGYIDLECTDVAGKWKTEASATSVIENAGLHRFGNAGGGGSGEGDASVFTYRTEDRLINSFWEYVTPIVFSVDEDALTDGTSTVSYDLVNGVYKFTGVGEIFKTLNLFDAQFLAENTECKAIELHSKWLDDAGLDEAAAVEVSIDGGTNYETVTMERIGQSSKMISLGDTGNEKVELTHPEAPIFTSASETAAEDFDGTNQKLASTFLVAPGEKVKVSDILAKISKTGSPLGSLRIAIMGDSTGPDDIYTFSSAFLSCAEMTAGNQDISVSSGEILVAGRYWLVLEVDADYLASQDGSNKISWRNTTGGSSYSHNGTIWSAGTLALNYVISGFEYDLRLKITGSAINKSLEAIALFYAEELDQAVTGYKEIQSFQFSGDDNKTQFEITNFLPNPETLLAFDVNTGQVYTYPAFNIDGRFIEFPSGMFNIAGESVIVKFIQYNGSYDNSDSNANLMATNHLGSSDSTQDKSVAGRGIVLRQETNGILKELALDENGFIQILSV